MACRWQAAFLPQISYLTLIDKYVLQCSALIYLSTVLHFVVGVLVHWLHASEETHSSLHMGCGGSKTCETSCKQRTVPPELRSGCNSTLCRKGTCCFVWLTRSSVIGCAQRIACQMQIRDVNMSCT